MCQACQTRKTIEEQNEKNRQQNEGLARQEAKRHSELLEQQERLDEKNRRQNEGLARQEAERHSELLEQQERLAREAASRAELHAYEQRLLAEQQLEIENEKLSEIQKQTKLIEEQSISIDEAFAEGYASSSFEAPTFLGFSGSKNFPETEICALGNHYLTKKLQRAFNEGASKKFHEIFSKDELWIKLLLQEVERVAKEQRDSFLALEADYPESVVIDLIIWAKEIFLNAGSFELRLCHKMTDDGDLVFVGENWNKVCDNPRVNEKFFEVFGATEVLEIVNEKSKSLARLRDKLIKFTSDAESVLWKVQNHEAERANWKTRNAIADFLLWGGLAFAGLMLFKAGYGIFNIFISFGLAFLALFLSYVCRPAGMEPPPFQTDIERLRYLYNKDKQRLAVIEKQTSDLKYNSENLPERADDSLISKSGEIISSFPDTRQGPTLDAAPDLDIQLELDSDKTKKPETPDRLGSPIVILIIVACLGCIFYIFSDNISSFFVTSSTKPPALIAADAPSLPASEPATSELPSVERQSENLESTEFSGTVGGGEKVPESISGGSVLGGVGLNQEILPNRKIPPDEYIVALGSGSGTFAPGAFPEFSNALSGFSKAADLLKTADASEFVFEIRLDRTGRVAHIRQQQLSSGVRMPLVERELYLALRNVEQWPFAVDSEFVWIKFVGGVR
jgi:hypothetical protein